MKKLILIASLLMASGLWAETPEICQIIDNEKSALAQTLEQDCREGDALMWNADGPGVAQYWIARFCILDKPIVLFHSSFTVTSLGVCTFRGGALMPRTSGK